MIWRECRLIGAGAGYVADKVIAAKAAAAADSAASVLGADGDPTNEVKQVGETLYHLTDYETAQKIKESGQLIASKWESGVCAWTKVPTLQQAADSGAAKLDYIVKFQTNYTSWVPDAGLKHNPQLFNIAVRSYDKVVEIYNIVIDKFH
ncbi:hypothetical protein [Lutispora sp.]|uniref:hypothetical protein n=1 Tax=Lutispora sp. TaxID=2828727 RepID=UPI0035690088